MSGNKKPDRPQAADPERKHLQTSQPSTLAPTSWEGTNKTNKDVMFSPEASGDPDEFEKLGDEQEEEEDEDDEQEEEENQEKDEEEDEEEEEEEEEEESQ